MRSGPGPEATVEGFSFQLGACWAELGPHYDSPNETVIPAGQNCRTRAIERKFRRSGAALPRVPCRRKPLAEASVRRDHGS